MYFEIYSHILHEMSRYKHKKLEFNSKLKTLATIVSILLIFAVCFYFLAIPRIINIEKYRLLIIRETYKSLKLPMEIGNSWATMTWNFGIKIHSDSIVIKHFDNTAYLATGPIDVEISAPYIFKKQIRVRSINVQNAAIDLKRLSNKKFDIEELISPKTKKLIKYKTIFHNTNININNYKIIFTDKFISPSPQYLISGNKLIISKFDPKKFIKVDVDGKIYSKNRPSTLFNASYNAELPLNTENIFKNQLSIKGKVKNLYPDMYSKYLQAYTEDYSYMTGGGNGDVIINLSRKESDIDEISFKGTVYDFSLYKVEGKGSPVFPGFTNVSFLVQQKSKNIIIRDFTFKNKDIDTKINGEINITNSKKPELNLNLISDDTKVEPVLNLLPKQNKYYNNILKKLKKYKIKGIVSTNLNIKGAPKDPSLFGALQLKNFSLSNKSKIINNANARVNFNDKTYNVAAHALIDKNEYLNVSGIFSTKDNKVNINVISNTIKWNSAQRLISALSDITNSKNDIIKRSHLAGKGSININISGGTKNPNIKGYLTFISAKVKSSRLPVPIADLNGQLKFNNKKIIFNNLRAKISHSNININGILGQNTKSTDINIKGKINSQDITKYVKPYTSLAIEAKGTFPLIASINGSIDNWKSQGHIYFDKGDYINLKQDIGLPLDKVRILNFKVSGNRKTIKIDNIELLAENDQSTSLTAITSQSADLSSLLVAKGLAYEIPSKKFLFNNFALNITNPLNIQMLNPAITTESKEAFFCGGNFTAKMQFTGAAAPLESSGDIILRNITIPSKKLTINFAIFNLTADKIILTDSDIVIANSQLKINATAEKEFKLPLTINKIEITSPDLNFDNIANAFKQNKTKQEGTVPLVIQDGNIQAQRFTTGKLIGTNLTSGFDLNRDETFELKKLSLNAENGTASGNLKYNIKSTDLEGNYVTKNMSANELATTFMNLSDEIYGNLNSNGEFKTNGTSKQEILTNTDGKIEFKIKDGHLVRLGSLEHLLLSANTLLGGIGNLNLNKITDLIVPEKTGYFKTLDGTITMNDGILHTDNTKSKGKNLSLHLKGSLRMSDDYADMVILGRIRRRTAGKLGPLGNISINKLIGDIPVVGFLPDSSGNEGLIDLVPLLDKIPVLDIGGRFARGRYRFFVVKIVGNLYDQTSVKSFRWITGKELRKYKKSKKNRA